MIKLKTINNFRKKFQRIFPQFLSLNDKLVFFELNHSLRWPKIQQYSTTTKVSNDLYKRLREDVKRN